MAIYDYLPRYHQIEANNLKALQPGFVVSQMKVDTDNCTLVTTNTVTGATLMENGNILTIGANGIKDVAAADDVLFVVYTEPLNTLVDAPEFFATNLDEEDVRLVQLIPGDEWMTDYDYFNDDAYASIKTYLEGRIYEVKPYGTSTLDTTYQGVISEDDWFKTTTLPNGTAAHHWVFIK